MTARGDEERTEPVLITGMQKLQWKGYMQVWAEREWTLISVWRSELNQGQTVELSEAGGVLQSSYA